MNIKNQRGEVSKILIIAGVVVFVLIVIVFGVVQLASMRKASSQGEDTNTEETTETPKEVEPVYETQVGNVRFLVESVQDVGSIIKAKSSYETDLTTTERFIKVVVGAQNKGKINTLPYSWDIGNIIDSEGRNFIPYDKAYYLLPRPDLCGAILKPEFDLLPCIKYYEVSKASRGLKIVVNATENEKQEALLDLNLNQ